jgi:hypothetical protein
MLPSTQQKFFKDYSFSLFPQLPTEIRNYIWNISAKDYPARIIDLREYRRPAKSLTESSSSDLQAQKQIDGTREIVGFKSRTPAPTVLYVCRDSRYIAQESYTKAFGTADMPAETWIDFEKDILYLSLDFCYVALEGWPDIRHSYPRTRFNTGRIERKEPHGYFLNELSQDIEKVKDLAISGHWSPGSCIWYTDVLVDILTINKLFVHLERFTLVDAQHTPDHTADLVFANESLYLSNGVQLQDPNYENMTEYRKGLLDYC